ncbi:MAG TPA: hypothetical protein VMB05_01320 [Solirubrobacteraceae bacterium]|nr:hypothetical protein [Solirubrobacteraceae bacterium]
MPRNIRQKVIAFAAVAVLLGGTSFAAVSATGQGNGHAARTKAHELRRLHRSDLQAAATYLGVSSEQLVRELSSKSLAQIAEAHGKSAQGLIDAIVSARRVRLAKVSATLPKRVRAEVSRTVKPVIAPSAGRALSLFTAPGHLGAAAADYLGITPAQLRSRLQAGSSLAQVARESSGKDEAGLVDALLAAKQQRIAAGVAAGQVSHERATRREQRLRTRIDALVQRKFAGSPKS